MTIVAYGYGISPGAGSGVTVVTDISLQLQDASHNIDITTEERVLKLGGDTYTLIADSSNLQLVVMEDELLIRSC